MLKAILFFILLSLTIAPAVSAQNETRPRTSATPAPTEAPQAPQEPPVTPPATRNRRTGTKTSRRGRTATTPTPAEETADENGVRATFADLVKAIEMVDVDGVTKIYWNSPQLLMFNRNGSVTKGWQQMRKNREATYSTVSDVKLTTRDVTVQMLGRDGAVLTCLWEQTQKNKDKQESSTGRMTLVFKRVEGKWRAIHLHTSPGGDE